MDHVQSTHRDTRVRLAQQKTTCERLTYFRVWPSFFHLHGAAIFQTVLFAQDHCRFAVGLRLRMWLKFVEHPEPLHHVLPESNHVERHESDSA